MNAVNEKNAIEQPAMGGFDRLILVLESWRLLLLGPVVAFSVAYGVCHIWQQSYTSYAILAIPLAPGQSVQLTQTPVQAAAMMVSPLVLDPILVAFDLSEGRTLEKARKKLAEKVRSSVGKDNLLRLEVTATSPVLAQKISNAIIETWLKTTAPGTHERADLEKKLENAKKSLAAIDHLRSAEFQTSANLRGLPDNNRPISHFRIERNIRVDLQHRTQHDLCHWVI